MLISSRTQCFFCLNILVKKYRNPCVSLCALVPGLAAWRGVDVSITGHSRLQSALVT